MIFISALPTDLLVSERFIRSLKRHMGLIRGLKLNFILKLLAKRVSSFKVKLWVYL